MTKPKTFIQNQKIKLVQNRLTYFLYNQSRLCGEKQSSLDFNNDNDSLVFDCNLCKNENDLSISQGDIEIKSQSNQYNISVTVHTENINANNVIVSFFGADKSTGLIVQSENKNATISSITSSNNNATASILMDLEGKNIDYIHIYIDLDNKVTNEPKDNNYVLVPVVKHKLRANLSVNTGYSLVDSAIKDYLKFFVDDVPQLQAYAIIAIGRNTNEASQYSKDTLRLSSNPFGMESSQIKANGKYLNKPYNGLIGSYQPISSKPIVFVYGNRIEGTIAALKEFISARDVFLSENTYSNWVNVKSMKLVILDDYDVNALGVMDLMHNAENNPKYKKSGFSDVVSNILNDNNYEISIKTVKTVNDNTK